MTGGDTVEWVRVDRPLTAARSAGAGATVNMVVLAVYAALVRQAAPAGRLSACRCAGGCPELEPVMGFFNNLVPIHLALDAAFRCVSA